MIEVSATDYNQGDFYRTGFFPLERANRSCFPKGLIFPYKRFKKRERFCLNNKKITKKQRVVITYKKVFSCKGAVFSFRKVALFSKRGVSHLKGYGITKNFGVLPAHRILIAFIVYSRPSPQMKILPGVPKRTLTVWFDVSSKRLYLHYLFLYFLSCHTSTSILV